MRKRDIPPVHPGEMLVEEFLVPLEMSKEALAEATFIPVERIQELIEGRQDISGEIALRLGRFFRTGPEFWLNLQCHYDLEVAMEELGDRIEREVKPRAA